MRNCVWPRVNPGALCLLNSCHLIILRGRMCRELIQRLQWLEMDLTIKLSPNDWMDEHVGEFDWYIQKLYGQIVADGREMLYSARGCANLPNVDLLYLLGFNILQYPIKHLVIATKKGMIPIPSPYGDTFTKRAPEWRLIKPILTVY